MRTALEQSLAWMGTPVMMSMLVGFKQTDPQFRQKLMRATDVEKVTEFFVLEQGETRFNLTWGIYDLSFRETPSDLDAAVLNALELTCSVGSPLAVFVFEDGFGLDYLTKPESAKSTYAAQVEGAKLIALDDEVRTSSAWIEELTSLKLKVLGAA